MLAWPIEVHFLSSVLELLATDLHLDVTQMSIVKDDLPCVLPLVCLDLHGIILYIDLQLGLIHGLPHLDIYWRLAASDVLQQIGVVLVLGFREVPKTKGARGGLNEGRGRGGILEVALQRYS